MRLDVNKLSSAVRLALTLGTVAAAGTLTANAQDTGNTTNTNQKSQALETIVVTGSNIRRVDIETANPVVTIDAAAIQSTGKLTLGDIVQNLPAQMNGTNPQVNNGGGSGSSRVSLRGLGSQRTLILIDGRVVLNKDIDAIPISAVERVEVLTAGASAVYGSSAIGGVVNVILKKNYQGAQVSVDYGISDHDDGQRKGVSFLFGHTSDKGSLIAGIDYNKTDSVMQANRKFSHDAKSLYGRGTGVSGSGSAIGAIPPEFDPSKVAPGGSSTGPNGKFTIPGTGPLFDHYHCKTLAHTPGTSGANAFTDYHCFVSNGTATTPSDKYNYAAVNLLMTPQERTNLYINGTYHLTDNVDVYLEGTHNKTQSGFQLAPDPLTTGGGWVISKDNMYNPFGQTFTGGLGAGLRLVAAGNRAAKTNNVTDQFSAGLKGHFGIFDQDWNWELGSSFGHISNVTTTLGLPDLAKLNVASGPSMLVNGVPTCVKVAGDPTTAIAGCVPFNGFNPYTPDQAAVLASIAAPALTNTWQLERIHHLDFNGGVFNLPAGTAQLAVGASYRKEYQNNTVASDLAINPATGNCTLGSQCTSHLQGGYNVKEAYGELFLPILKDLPFVNSLNVTLSDRYSKYSTFGSTNNAAIGVEFKPIDDLLLRGNYNKVFRAPTVSDVFGAPISDAPKLSHDPCDYAGGTNPNASNPACAGVPTTGGFSDPDVAQNLQIKGIASGSNYAGFPIKAEKGATFNWGFVYSPHWVDGLSLSADFWRVKIEDTITSVGAQQVLDSCFVGQSGYCPLVHRFNTGQIDFIVEPTGNVGRIDVKGADFSVKYRLPQFAFGNFSVGLDATYLAKYDQTPNPGFSDLVYHNAGHLQPFGSAAQAACPETGGGVCLFPRWRALASVNWNLGSWDASWRMRYIGKFRNGSGRADQDSFPAGQCYYSQFGKDCSLHNVILHYGARTYNDVQVGYNIEPINTRVDVGIDNVGDIQPPYLWANNTLNANTDPGNFDMLGRYYFARVTVKF
ncbi:MAG TPA: TonB-dependent receptor [Rudaea sp.]|nr:TonB-dependent receptor [Rudaea sp.]